MRSYNTSLLPCSLVEVLTLYITALGLRLRRSLLVSIGSLGTERQHEHLNSAKRRTTSRESVSALHTQYTHKMAGMENIEVHSKVGLLY